MSRRKPYEIAEAPEGAPAVWQSLEEKQASPQELRKQAEAEHPGGFLNPKQLTRRHFLGVTGVGAAATGLAGCGALRRPKENILPFTEGPEYVIPGKPLHFATVTQRRGEALGLLVTSHEGRPTKVEGNPDHPTTQGATDTFAQASVMNLYDPHRSTGPAKNDGGELVDVGRGQADKALDKLFADHEQDEGARLRILTEPTNSPLAVDLKKAVQKRFPKVRFHTYASVNEGNELEGTRIAFGRPLRSMAELSSARVVLALDSDFLGLEAGAVRNSRAFAQTRSPRSPSEEMARLYAVEATFSVTGASADHRLRLPSGEVGAYLAALARELVSTHGLDLGALGSVVQNAAAPEGVPEMWIRHVAAALVENRNAAPLLVGSRQPAWVQALAHTLNVALGNVDRTIRYVEPVDPDDTQQVDDLQALVKDIRAGKVGALVMVGTNPVYDAPSDVEFAKALRTEGLVSVHLASHRNETSARAHWHVPRAHELESWDVQRALDGTVTVQQPLIRPLFGGTSDVEMLGRMAGKRNWHGHHLVRQYIRKTASVTGGFEAAWRRALHRGFIRGSGDQAVVGAPKLDKARVADAVKRAPQPDTYGPKNLEVIFAEDYAVLDGTFANNPWMLEFPHPMTRVMWDNAAQISPATARQLNVETGDRLRLSRKGASPIEIAAIVVPGHADGSITLPLGWGRTRAGAYGNGAGFDVHPLRTTGDFHFASGVQAEKIGQYELARFQMHSSMEGRPLAIDATLNKVDTSDSAYGGMPAYREQPSFGQWRSVLPTIPPLWEEQSYAKGIKWGMTIDLSACTGCGSCVVACQAENNIPVVGKQQAAIGRAMHWIRVDRYFVGEDEENPLVAMQTVTCQHCEEAPCENVCPVNATAHSPEGLNDMAYNRCIGTRYCMNNCPYKVRRFNYLNWNGHLDKVKNDMDGFYGDIPELHKMQKNPNVSVRHRGVMEKCTYCVQRIQAARIDASRDGRELKGEDVQTACQQACPSRAITFGDLNDKSETVTQLAGLDRHYKLLAEVGTQPRTTYLGKIRNPSPAMLPKGHSSGKGKPGQHGTADDKEAHG